MSLSCGAKYIDVSIILLRQLFVLNFCIISNSVKEFSDRGKEMSRSQKVKSLYLKRPAIV